MKVLIAIALMTVIPVRGRTLSGQDPSDEIESQQSVASPEDYVQDEPNVGQDTDEDNYEGTEELARIARQYPAAYMGNHGYDYPAARTLGALAGLGGLSGSLQQNVRLGMGSPGLSPVVPLPLAHGISPPVQSQPYIAGYTLMPVYSEKQVPLMPPPLPPVPCPHDHHHHHAPYTFPPQLPPLPPSPSVFFNRQLSMGMGRSAHEENYYPHITDPWPYSYARSSEPVMHIDPSQYNYIMMDHPYYHHYADYGHSMEPSNLVANSVAPDPPTAPAEELPENSDTEAQTNV